MTLTVNDPATPPTSPISPRTGYVLGLAALVGLFAGLGTAVARSRADSTVHTARATPNCRAQRANVLIIGPAMTTRSYLYYFSRNARIS